jgi:hypothetical protein
MMTQGEDSSFKKAPRAKHGRCFYHDESGCKFSAADCRFEHVGEAGNGFKAPSTSSKRPTKKSEYAKIAAVVKAMLAEEKSTTPPKTNWYTGPRYTNLKVYSRRYTNPRYTVQGILK